MQTSHHNGAHVVALMPHRNTVSDSKLSPAAMAAYLRETSPLSARCFALEMHAQAAWANEAWGEFWAEVAQLL